MLVLSRKVGEQILIGDLIEVTVVAVQGNRVKLGISAPADVAVHRREVWEAVRAFKSEAENAAGIPSDRVPVGV